MALQVWLPLTGNLENKGLCNITATNTGATESTAGKIGSCYSYTTTQSSYLEITGLPFTELTNCSISFWIKVDSMSTNGWLMFTGQSTSYYVMATQKGTGTFYHGNAGSNLKIYKDGVLNSTPGTTGEWHHYVVTGVNLSTWTKFYLDKYSAAWNFAGEVNDIRIYDHILSKKEIHNLAQGLVLHYKLTQDKLKICEYLEKSSAVGTKDYIDTGVSGYTIDSIRCVCKASINTTGDSAFFGSRGNYYLFYNFSGNYFWPQSKAETINGTLTTNTKYIIDYNKGHLTVVDEDGYLYQEANRSGTAVQNLNLYIFNFNPVDNRTAQAKIYYFKIYNNDELIRDFVPCIYNGEPGFWERLSGIFYGNKGPGAFTAGPELISESNIVYDCSGYGNDGTITGSITANSDTARYDSSTKFPDSACAIGIGNLTTLIPTGVFTFNIWFKKDTGEWSSKSWETILGGPSGFELEGKLSGTQNAYVHPCSWGGGSTTTPNSYSIAYELDTWNMLTMVRNETGTKFYLNGEWKVNGSGRGAFPSGDYFIGAWKTALQQNFRGHFSDARIYATALSDEDIKELYDTAATIDKGGNFHSFEFYEDNIEKGLVEKTGEVKTNDFIEKLEYLYLPASRFVNTQLYYDDGDQCKAVTVIRYASGESGRDLMGYSSRGSGYWGVTAAGAWEDRGTITYTDSDITKINTVTYIFSSAVEHGYYQVGALGGTWSPRSKYIYSVKLWKNGTLERDMVPVKIGNDYGLYDIVTYTFYPCNNNTNVTISSDPVNTTIFKRHIDTNQLLEK